PKKVPRPRNAFIIFRCEKIQSLHSQSTAGMDRPATPEKTLSKRAGAAWRLLPADEKERFREMAEQERREHLKKYPDYRYQPNRSKASKP
ncbi:high mobility group box, partial [Trametopsis cervina]